MNSYKEYVIHRNDTMYEIYPRVYFGSASATYDSEQMKKITHVVNCDSVISSTSPQGQRKHFLFLKSYDDEEFNILETHSKTLTDYIDIALKNPTSNVYIHCYMGWNRSACLGVCYRCSKTNESARAVIREIRESREILSNEDFEHTLLHIYP